MKCKVIVTEVIQVCEEEDTWTFCTCCGKPLDGDENIVKDTVPYPYDKGFGLCKECGGDPDGKTLQEKLGWGYCTFMEARFDVVRKALSEEKQAKWDTLDYLERCKFITKAIGKGMMI